MWFKLAVTRRKSHFHDSLVLKCISQSSRSEILPHLPAALQWHSRTSAALFASRCSVFAMCGRLCLDDRLSPSTRLRGFKLSALYGKKKSRVGNGGDGCPVRTDQGRMETRHGSWRGRDLLLLHGFAPQILSHCRQLNCV